MKSKTIISFLTLLLLIPCTNGTAQVPQLMNYQGRLTDNNGAPLDTVVNLTFTLYQDQGGSNSLWTETQSSITVADGLFSVLLGSVTSIPSSVFDGTVRYLGVQMDGGSATSSLMPIVSAAYAIKAGHADTAQVALSGGSSVWSTLGNNTYYNTGYVGIGTNAPSNPLEIIGSLAYANLGGNFALAGGHTMSGSNGYLGGTNVGAFGSGNLYGVWGISNGGYGIFGQATSGGYAGYFEGKTRVTGDFLLSDTGKIGIGTSTIGARLDLAGPEDSDLLIFEAGDADRFSITTHASGTDYLSIRSKFENPDSQIVVFTGNGRVGIGTDSPDASLNAISSSNTAIHGISNNTLHYGIHGENTYNGYGVYGSSSNGGGVRGESTSGPGVSGHSTDSPGVMGISVSDYGVYGQSTNGDGVHASNSSSGNQAYLGGSDYALKTDGDIYIESGAVRGNIGPNNGAPFPRPAYDSGWILVPPDSTIFLIHGVGGNANNYFVDMQFNGVGGVSNHRIGGDTYYLPPLGERKGNGMSYHGLTSDQIRITNYDTYGTTDEYVRIRIWVYM